MIVIVLLLQCWTFAQQLQRKNPSKNSIQKIGEWVLIGSAHINRFIISCRIWHNLKGVMLFIILSAIVPGVECEKITIMQWNVARGGFNNIESIVDLSLKLAISIAVLIDVGNVTYTTCGETWRRAGYRFLHNAKSFIAVALHMESAKDWEIEEIAERTAVISGPMGKIVGVYQEQAVALKSQKLLLDSIKLNDKEPMWIMGDFNASMTLRTGSKADAQLNAWAKSNSLHWIPLPKNEYTYCGMGNKSQIDRSFCNQRAMNYDCKAEVIKESLPSDHRPVKVDISDREMKYHMIQV